MTKHQTIDVPLNVTVGGRFKLEAIRPDGTRRVVADWFDNLVLNQGLDHLAILNQYGDQVDTGVLSNIAYCHVGSGNTAPLPSDTSLVSLVAASNTKTAGVGGNSGGVPEWYFWTRQTIRFAVGVAAGNISEVGMGWGSAYNQLFSRALVKDQFGNPITITILSDEILDVTYEFRLYPPAADATFNVLISGTTYSCTARALLSQSAAWGGLHNNWWAANLLSRGVGVATNNYSGGVGEAFILFETDILFPLSTAQISTNPKYIGLHPTDQTVNAYVPGSYTQTFTTTIPLTAANFATGIGMFCPTVGLGSWQISFTPKIQKDNTKVLTLNWQVSWSRRP